MPANNIHLIQETDPATVLFAPSPDRPEVPFSKLLRDFKPPSPDNENELLKHRFLNRGGGMLLVGPTGIGKSSLTMQLSILWSLGKPGFGILPARPLKILIVQAENDDEDMFEMKDGVRQGLGLTQDEWEKANDSIRVCSESSRSGRAFFSEAVRPLLEEHRPDLLIVDPAFAYLGGETNNQGHVSAFLRNSLNPLLQEFRCGALIIHHTNKPPTGEEKVKWTDSQMAYAGAGSAEWANWARGFLAMRATSDRGVFQLVAAKRGARLRWRESDGETLSFRKHIKHSRNEGEICWHELTSEEVAALDSALPGESRQRPIPEEEILALLPEGRGSIEKEQFIQMAADATGLSGRQLRGAMKNMESERKVFTWAIHRQGTRHAVHWAREPQEVTVT